MNGNQPHCGSKHTERNRNQLFFPEPIVGSCCFGNLCVHNAPQYIEDEDIRFSEKRRYNVTHASKMGLSDEFGSPFVDQNTHLKTAEAEANAICAGEQLHRLKQL